MGHVFKACSANSVLFLHRQPLNHPEMPLLIKGCFSPSPAHQNIREFNASGTLLPLDVPNLQILDRSSLLNLIKTCGKEKNMWKVRRIHNDLLKKNLISKDAYIATSLITAYAKCGMLDMAREIFEQIPIRNVVSWNALISGYAQNGLGDEALKCFKEMQENANVCPNGVTFVCTLKACGIVGCIDIGEVIDVEVRKQGLLQRDIMVGTALVDMYCKCGALEKAREVFSLLPAHDVVSWSALIAGYVNNGLTREALQCFKEMQDARISPDVMSYVFILKACAIQGSLDVGEDIHTEVKKRGLLQRDIVLGNALIDVYSKCGALEKAREVFEQIPMRNVVSWSALIGGYAQHGLGDEALRCFKQMQDALVRPNVVTYICVLKACGIVRSLGIGEKIDMEIRKQGLFPKEIVLSNALVDMYSKCGAIEKAREVFQQLPVRNVVSWTSLIAAYVQNGLADEALECFRQMQDEGVYPDTVAYVCILKACGIIRSLKVAEEIHAEIKKLGLLQKDVVLGTALVDMYFKCGALEKAHESFEELPIRNVVTWSALIAGYVQHGLGDEALKCYMQMQDAGVCPNLVTYMCVLSACGIVGSLEVGKDIDAEVQKNGLLQKDILLGNALVDMYSKCGALEKAQQVFQQLPVRNVVTWSALIAGYAQLGKANIVLNLYRRMREKGIAPDSVTFTVLFTACSHAGLVKEGEKLFNEMCIFYYLTPMLEHYMCMIDLFGRAGHFDKVNDFLDKVSPSDRLSLLVTLLGACKKWTNVKLGRWVFEESLQLDENCIAAYVSMENICATASKQTEAPGI